MPVTRARRFAGIRVSPVRRGDFLAELSAELDRAPRADRTRPLTVTYLNPDYARRALRSPSPNAWTPTPSRRTCSAGSPAGAAGCSCSAAHQGSPNAPPPTSPRPSPPGARRRGVEHGYHDVERGHPGHFADEDSRRIVDRINAAAPDLLLVSLPTPLQQRWVAAYAESIGARVVMTAGSYLDHLADPDVVVGDWYPRWANALRLNWFYRLLREPRRLWRRYTVELAGFVVLVLLARLNRVRPVGR